METEQKTPKKATWNDVFERHHYVSALPLKGAEGKSLYMLVMLKAALSKAVEAFEQKMADALKKLKEEKYPAFDEEMRKPEAERCEGYDKMLAALEEDYAAMRLQEGDKEADNAPAITAAHLEAACSTGAGGTAEIGRRQRLGADGQQMKGADGQPLWESATIPLEQLLVELARMVE